MFIKISDVDKGFIFTIIIIKFFSKKKQYVPM